MPRLTVKEEYIYRLYISLHRAIPHLWGEHTTLSYMKTNMHCVQTDFTSQIVSSSTRYTYWMGRRSLELHNYTTATSLTLSIFCFNCHLLLCSCCFIVMIHIWEERNAACYNQCQYLYVSFHQAGYLLTLSSHLNK